MKRIICLIFGHQLWRWTLVRFKTNELGDDLFTRVPTYSSQCRRCGWMVPRSGKRGVGSSGKLSQGVSGK